MNACSVKKVSYTYVTVSRGLKGAEGDPETDMPVVARGGEEHSTVLIGKQ